MALSPNIILGVSGGIAAYKAPELIRRLRDRGAKVRCGLSANAARFVSPLALEVVTGHAVYDEGYLEPSGRGVEEHIELSDWADCLVVAPATASVLARLALGLGTDFLSTLALAWSGPLVVAPAMHPKMWNHPATQENLRTLVGRGVHCVGPETGPLASGEIGVGRMSEPESLVERIFDLLSSPSVRAETSLAGLNVLVSAGPTREPVDPVRFLGNRSSGKMGFALAEEAARRGADVHLVSGPVALRTPVGVARVDVETALEMREALVERVGEADLVFMAAAVADYRPREAAPEKLKKSVGPPVFELIENPDILVELSAVKGDRLMVGFAAETDNLLRNAREKMGRKRCDLLVANDVSRSDIGFEVDANEVTVLSREGEDRVLARRPKAELAAALLDIVEEELRSRA